MISILEILAPKYVKKICEHFVKAVKEIRYRFRGGSKFFYFFSRRDQIVSCYCFTIVVISMAS